MGWPGTATGRWVRAVWQLGTVKDWGMCAALEIHPPGSWEVGGSCTVSGTHTLSVALNRETAQGGRVMAQGHTAGLTLAASTPSSGHLFLAEAVGPGGADLCV